MLEKGIFQTLFKKKIKKIEKCPFASLDSVTNRVACSRENIFRYKIHFFDNSNVSFVGKWKSKKIIANGVKLLSGGNPILAFFICKNHKILGFNESFKREMIFYRNVNETLKHYLIPVIGAYQNGLCNKYLIALKEIKCGNKVSKGDIYKVIDAIIDFHVFYYNNKSAAKVLCLNEYSYRDYLNNKTVIKKMFNALADKNEQDYGGEITALINTFINNIENEYQKVSHHNTLTHNDFSGRNVFVRENDVYIYDWEMACYQNPEHDLIEFLISVMDKLDDEDVVDVINYYKIRFSENAGIDLSNDEYKAFLRFNLLEYCANKLNILRIANVKMKLDFVNAFTENACRLIKLLRLEKGRV